MLTSQQEQFSFKSFQRFFFLQGLFFHFVAAQINKCSTQVWVTKKAMKVKQHTQQ
jgi:hypothetical protein